MAGRPVTLTDQLRDNAVAIRQVAANLAEAERLRTDAVAAGAFDLVRRHERRIEDLASNKRALSEHRAHLARQATEADLAARTQARDQAIAATVQPKLEAVLEQVVALERVLEEFAKGFRKVKETLAEYLRSWPKEIPPVADYLEFTLVPLQALLKQTLTACARDGLFEHVMVRWDEHPSEAMRRWLTAFLAKLRSAELPAKRAHVRDLESDAA